MENSYEPDTCCGKHIVRAISEGKLDAADSWECPKCGLEWKPRVVGTLRHWEPHPVLLVTGRLRCLSARPRIEATLH